MNSLYAHFESFVIISQHGLFKNKSVLTNLKKYLQYIHESFDDNPSTDIIAFYTDFAKAFDKVPHTQLIFKLRKLCVGGCFLDLLINYLENRKHFVQLGNVQSTGPNLSSGVPQGSVVGPILFFSFLPESFWSSYSLLFVDDLKFITRTDSKLEIFLGLKRLEKWIGCNNMKFTDDKNGFLQFRVKNTSFVLNNEVLKPAAVMKDLGIHVRYDLTWSCPIDEKLKKSIRILHFVKRNTSENTIPQAKLCLYQSMVLPIISYASTCTHLTELSVHKLEIFQKFVLKWVLHDYSTKYQSLLKIVNMLPLCLFFQILGLLELLYKIFATDF